MIQRIPRALACGALAAFLGAALVAVFYAVHSSVLIEFDRDLPRLVSGVYRPERDAATGLTFAWSGREMAIRLPGLDRRVDWVVDVRLRGARPIASENPVISFSCDGLVLEETSATVEFQDVRVVLPARPERTGVVFTMSASRTFVPGPADTRELGVMLDRIKLSPSGVVFPPRPTVGATAIAAAIIGAALALLGMTLIASMSGSVIVASGAAALIAKGFGPFTGFPATMVDVAFWTGVFLVVAARLIAWRAGSTLRNTARFALAFAACGAFIKLLVLMHPDLPIGDAMFHAHRFRTVVDGNLFFTSTAPGNYQFPYAPGLYVVAAPFASFVTRDFGDMALLRILVVAFDAVASALLYLVIVRAWADRLAGAIAVALYQLAPLSLGIMTVGNLTNAFAQSLAVFSLALIASPVLRLEHRSTVVALAGLLLAAYLSHTSTFALLLAATVCIPLAFRWKGGPALRSPAAAVVIASFAAVLLAVVIYYAHFIDTYRAELMRLSTETISNAPDAGGRTVLDRLSAAPRYLRLYFGIPLLALAAIGTYHLFIRGARDRGTLSVLGWAMACTAFLAVGILTPLDMRYHLAAIPALAVAASAGASWLWTAGGANRLAALTLLAWAAYTGATAILNF